MNKYVITYSTGTEEQTVVIGANTEEEARAFFQARHPTYTILEVTLFEG